MGSIVFSTIIENIKSFFGREDELLHSPKGVPEAASEVFEHTDQQKIVEKKLPNQELPFTPDQLRSALKEKPPIKQSPPVQEEDITHEISEFETALVDIPHEEEHYSEPPTLPQTQETHKSGFFNEFEQFLLHEDLQTEGVLDADVLHRMKEFHKHQQQGKEYYIYSKDVKAAIQRKIQELKMLEHEWFHSRQQIDELERDITTIEHEIELRSHDVKALIAQARSKSRLEQTVSKGHEFVLADGRKLSSLLDLKLALRTMPQEVFSHHVSAKKNDFATWIEDALNQKEIAKNMETILGKQELDMFLSKLDN